MILEYVTVDIHLLGESNAFRSIVSALEQVELETAKSGMVDYWRRVGGVRAKSTNAFETFFTSERVVRKMSRQKKRKKKRSCALKNICIVDDDESHVTCRKKKKKKMVERGQSLVGRRGRVVYIVAFHARQVSG